MTGSSDQIIARNLSLDSQINPLVKIKPALSDKELEAIFETKGYQIIENIHQGTFSKCWLTAITEDSNTSLKVIKVEINSSISQRFLLQEYQILSKISHPNITSTPKLMILDELHFLIYPYYGLDLVQLISRKMNQVTSETDYQKQLPLEICQIVIRKITQAVNYLHQNGIYHRDIKTENIIIKVTDLYHLSETSSFKLIDFGFSTQTELKEISINQWKGTREYTSPECLKRKKIINLEKVDVWCIGSTFYSLVVGGFVPKSYQKSIKNSKLEDILPKRWLSNPIIMDIFSGCLAIKPKDRITTNDLQAILDQWH